MVRFRHNNDGTGYGSEDIGRMQTQQNFLKAVAKKTLTVSNLTKLDSFVKIQGQQQSGRSVYMLHVAVLLVAGSRRLNMRTA